MQGASDDIRRAKQILYSAMTWDPATATSNNFTPNYSRSTTPAPTPLLTSPPMSPRSISRASSSGGGGGASGLARVSTGEQQQQQQGVVAAAAAAVAAADNGSSSSNVQAVGGVLVQASSSSQDGAAAAAAAAAGPPGSDIVGMPQNPLQHLQRLNELMKTMVEQVRLVTCRGVVNR
jgi:hypothetical protein